MAKFKYVGSGDTPPEKIKFMGEVTFLLNGEAVAVKNERIIAKLRGNMSFIEVKGKAKPEKVEVEEIEELETEIPTPKAKKSKKAKSGVESSESLV